MPSLEHRPDRQGKPEKYRCVQRGTYGTSVCLVPAFLDHRPRFGELARRLGPAYPIYSLLTPKPSERPNHKVSLEALGAEGARVVCALQKDAPIHLVGYSTGALLAYEIARQLHERKKPVGAVCLLDYPVHTDYVPSLSSVVNSRLFRPVQEIPRFSFLQYLKCRIARLIRRAPELPTWTNLLTAEFRRDYLPYHQAAKQYRPQPSSIPLLLIRSNWEPGRWRMGSFEPSLGWRSVARGPLEIRHVPCSHEELLEESYAESVALILRHAIGAGTSPLRA